MDSVIASLDAAACKSEHETKLGENGHVEYKWNEKDSAKLSDYRERIVQLNFQLVRSNEGRLVELCGIYEELMNDLNWALLASCWDKDVANLWLMTYSLIGYVRDIIKGKGECALAYGMVCALIRSGRGISGINTIEPAKHAINQWFLEYSFDSESGQHPYGSWKDMKYFIKFMLDDSKPELNPESEVEPMIQHLLQKTLEQVIIDESNDKPSLCARWCPRETSKKFGFIFRWLAKKYFSSYIETGRSVLKKTDCLDTLIAAQKKSYMEFRKILSGINRRLCTPQINQCSGNWQAIDFEKHVTSVTMSKQKKAFMNIKGSNGEARSWEEDRITCSQNYKNYIDKVVNGTAVARGKRVSMASFTKEALNILESKIPIKDKNSLQKMVDAQWESNATTTNALKQFIAMVDTSGSMYVENSDPLHNAIALGIRIAEKSALGQRVMTFDEEPSWINLESEEGFCKKVWAVSKVASGLSTNFYKAFNLILDACKEQKLSRDDVKNMVLVVLSDMQINIADNDRIPMMEVIKKRYAEAGRYAIGEPWEVPTIVFWNLRSTDGFPAISNDNNAIMISGASPVLANDIASRGCDAIHDFNPWSVISETLSSSRFYPMTRRFDIQKLRSTQV